MPRSRPAPNGKLRLSTFQERVLTVLLGAIHMGTCLGPTGPRVSRTRTTVLRHQQRPLSSLSLISKCQGGGGRRKEPHSPRPSSTGPAQKDLVRMRCPRPPAFPTSSLRPTHIKVLATSHTAHWCLYQDPWLVTEEMRQPTCKVETTPPVTWIWKTHLGRIAESGAPGLARTSGRVQE